MLKGGGIKEDESHGIYACHPKKIYRLSFLFFSFLLSLIINVEQFEERSRGRESA